MTPYKAPGVYTKRSYPLYQQIGLVASLGVLLVAFSVPISGSADVEQVADEQEIIEIEDIAQTRLLEPPPPPPPAAPPPQEVPDNAVIEEEIIQEIDLDFDATVAVPLAPPAPATPPPAPPAPVATPTAPPPPPPEPTPTEPEIFEVVEQQPELIGGLQGLLARLEYPSMARQAGVEGKVFVRFVVDERGEVSQAEAIRCPNALLCDAAVAAIEASTFRPGLQRGRAVKVRFVIPVTFELSTSAPRR